MLCLARTRRIKRLTEQEAKQKMLHNTSVVARKEGWHTRTLHTYIRSFARKHPLVRATTICGCRNGQRSQRPKRKTSKEKQHRQYSSRNVLKKARHQKRPLCPVVAPATPSKPNASQLGLHEGMGRFTERPPAATTNSQICATLCN